MDVVKRRGPILCFGVYLNTASAQLDVSSSEPDLDGGRQLRNVHPSCSGMGRNAAVMLWVCSCLQSAE